MRKRLITLSLALATALGGVNGAYADKYVYNSWFGDKHTVNNLALRPILERITEETGGDATWELVVGAQLASGPGTPEAVGTGLVDGGMAFAPYQPRLLAATNTIFSNSLLGPDVMAAVAAMNETVMFGCPECQEEYAEMNAVGFAGYAVTPYRFMCRDVISSLSDLEGLKIRSSGGGVSISEIAGATPVSMSPGEATSGLERGTLDCVLGSISWLHSFGYMDVVKSVVDSPMGNGGPPLLMFLNRDVWQSMSPETRATHIRLAPELIVLATLEGQIENDEGIIQAAKDRGIIFTPDGPEWQAVMTEHDKRQRQRIIDQATEAGVEHPGEILDFYIASYARWQALLDEKGRDHDTIVQLLWDEVYSKVDPEAL